MLPHVELWMRKITGDDIDDGCESGSKPAMAGFGRQREVAFEEMLGISK